MYKIKEVCRMTGLTEKAIRIYMDQKLVEPKVEEGIHRNAYFFRESDVERLKDIATLRSAGFGMAEIKQMLENPEKISLLVEEKKALLEGEILQKLAIQDTLNHLTIEEHSDVTKLVDAIEPRSTYAKETPKKRVSRRQKWFILIWIGFTALGLCGITSGKAAVLILISSFGLGLGIFAVISGMRYLLYSRKADKRKSRGVGKITAVVENERVETYIGEQERSTMKDIMAYLAFGIFGEGIWNMLRPDAWHPVVSYQTDEDNVYTATTRYGGFRNSWQMGETLPIAWEDGKERLIHICDGTIFRKKAYFYLGLGMLLFMMFGIGMVQLFALKENKFETSSAAQTPRLEYPMEADRVKIGEYELDEEETEVLKTLLREAEIGDGEANYIKTEGVAAIYFYQGELEIEKFIADDFCYIFTSDNMRYPMKPVHLEFRGVDLGESGYITGFLNQFEAKVRQRYVTEAILELISTEQNLEGLKKLLGITEYFEGAYAISNGYQFLFTEKGYVNYFGKHPEEHEFGKVEVILQNGKFVNAAVTSWYDTEEGAIETYRLQYEPEQIGQ